MDQPSGFKEDNQMVCLYTEEKPVRIEAGLAGVKYKI